MNRHSLSWLVSGAGVVVALLVANVALTFTNIRQLHDDAYWVAHTREVLTGLENVLSLAKDAETGQRGFVITGEPRYLEPYNAALAAIDKQVDDLERLTEDNPHQQARFPELRGHIAAKLKELDHTIALRKNDGFAAARRVVLTDRGKKEMDALRVVIGEMIRTRARPLAGSVAEVRADVPDGSLHRAAVGPVGLGGGRGVPRAAGAASDLPHQSCRRHCRTGGAAEDDPRQHRGCGNHDRHRGPRHQPERRGRVADGVEERRSGGPTS